MPQKHPHTRNNIKLYSKTFGSGASSLLIAKLYFAIELRNAYVIVWNSWKYLVCWDSTMRSDSQQLYFDLLGLDGVETMQTFAPGKMFLLSPTIPVSLGHNFDR